MKNRIRELRQAYRIKQAELAKYLGIAQNTLSYWEQGKYDVDTASLQKIADYFHCSVDCVLCREDIPREKNTEDFLGELLSDHEKELIKAYRNQPEMQKSVCRLLGIEYISPSFGYVETPEGELIIYRAAKSSDNHEHQIEKRSGRDISKLANAGKVASEDDL